MIAAAPLFVWSAGRFGLLISAVVLGVSRVAASVIGYIYARRLYDVTYPWYFAAKVTAVSLTMAAVLGAVRRVWNTSAVEAATLTALGIVIVLVGLRVFRVMGPGDLDVLQRASIPGNRVLARWLRAA
jgi:hypothetical protein